MTLTKSSSLRWLASLATLSGTSCGLTTHSVATTDGAGGTVEVAMSSGGRGSAPSTGGSSVGGSGVGGPGPIGGASDSGGLPGGFAGASGSIGGAGGVEEIPESCGDGVVQTGEACDDGNATTSDGCGHCQRVTHLATGAATCVIDSGFRLKCWGVNFYGLVGLGKSYESVVGDQPDEIGENLAFVDLGSAASVTAVSTRNLTSCALLDNGSLKCWGNNENGNLGLGDTEARGDEPGEMGNDLPTVELGSGRSVLAVTMGLFHACAVLDSGVVKCWGGNFLGSLGLGDSAKRGIAPTEMGDNLPEVALGTGRSAISISAGNGYTCAVLDDASLKCWGYNYYGELGLGDSQHRGDAPGEMGDSLPAVDLGTGRSAVAVSCGDRHTCALLDDGSVKCWGDNDFGQLGLGDTMRRGDGPGEMGDTLPSVDLGTGRTAIAISAGSFHTCALLDDSSLKCWGHNSLGPLGLGDTRYRGIGPGEMGDDLPSVDLGTGRHALQISAGQHYTCALLDDDTVKCWGAGPNLGIGDNQTRGDEPNEMGDALPTLLVP